MRELGQDASRARPRNDTGDELTAPRAVRTMSPRELRTLHLDLLGRPPLVAEHRSWSARDFQDLVEHLVGSADFWRQWVEEQLYHLLLVDNFKPDPALAAELATALAEGRLDVRLALHRIALSPTFDLRNPGADTYVTVVLEQFCGIQVQRSKRELESGKRAYDGQAATFLGHPARSQSDVLRIAVESREFARTLAEREYRRHMQAAPETRLLEAWTQALHQDPARFIELLKAALLSDVYGARLARPVPTSNRLFVRSLYVDLLDRTPERGEAEPLREALDALGDSMPLRSVLVRLLLDSGRAKFPSPAEIPDHAAFVGERFRCLLGRDALPEELSSFVSAFSDPACRVETLYQAILTHPEYHRH